MCHRLFFPGQPYASWFDLFSPLIHRPYIAGLFRIKSPSGERESPSSSPSMIQVQCWIRNMVFWTRCFRFFDFYGLLLKHDKRLFDLCILLRCPSWILCTPPATLMDNSWRWCLCFPIQMPSTIYDLPPEMIVRILREVPNFLFGNSQTSRADFKNFHQILVVLPVN